VKSPNGVARPQPTMLNAKTEAAARAPIASGCQTAARRRERTIAAANAASRSHTP
jgi:hypothetical protein